MRGSHEDKEHILERLRKIEGQLRGLQRLVTDDRYCIDILTQISAAESGPRKVALKLVDGHIRHCVAESLANGEDAEEKVGEATAAIGRLLRA